MQDNEDKNNDALSQENQQTNEIDGVIKEKADNLHVKIIDAQLEMIESLTKDKEKLTDSKHVRLLNEVLSSAATTALGTKKIAIDAQSSNQQSAMVAFMLSMAKSEPETAGYLKTIVDNTARPANGELEPVIDIDVKFHPEALVQGQKVISFEDIGKT